MRPDKSTIVGCMTSQAAAGLIVRGLRKAFGGLTVLDGIELSVTKGHLVAVLGPSGSGKTTLLRLLCGFERADGGTIELGDRLVANGRMLHMPPEKRGTGYVAQEGALFPHLSVQDNILFGLPRRQRKMARSSQSRRIGELLELVGLSANYAKRAPHSLSGGEQQRVALARALAPNPSVVLLDEPFSALDAGLRSATRQAIADSLKQVQTTALLVTHDQTEALSMGDEVALLHHGRLAQVATPQRLYRHPVNRDIARFVGHAVLVPGNALDGHVTCCFGSLPLTRETTGSTGAVEVLIRPEQFRLCDASDPDNTAETIHSAYVEQLRFNGHDAHLTLRLKDHPSLPPFLATVPGINLPDTGQTVHFKVIGEVTAWPRVASD